MDSPGRIEASTFVGKNERIVKMAQMSMVIVDRKRD